MPSDPERATAGMRLAALLRIPPPGDDPRAIFEVRTVGILPGWLQVALVALLFLATTLLTHHEYRTKGTSFGFAGPAFNMLVNPIYEELIFRGWILARLARWRGPAAAIAISSLLFGLLHVRNIFWLDTGDLVRNVLATGLVVGPILGYVALRCRSVWPAVILHYLNNLAYFVRH